MKVATFPAAALLLILGLAVGACGGNGGEAEPGSPAPGLGRTATAAPVSTPVTSPTAAGDSLLAALRGADYPLDLARGRALGSANAPVVVTVYEDFQCPYCLRFTAGLEQFLVANFVEKGTVRLEFRHWPVLGRESVQAAIAAQCAADQDRFWPFAHELFLLQAEAGQHVREQLNVGRFSDEALAALATTAGLDAAAWDVCYRTASLAVIEEDVRSARGLGLPGTPGFAVNGQALPGGPASETAWRQVIEAARGR